VRGANYEFLVEEQRKLLDAAEEVMKTAYNPYSRFYVGAALLTQSGKIISGSNVENAAYGSTICAERAALLRANAQGERMFSSIAIIARGETFDTADVTGPCGSCRQMIYEASQISGKNLEVILSTTKKDKIVITDINELLPLAFGPNELGVDIKRYQTKSL
jgi:cytidine deaminase